MRTWTAEDAERHLDEIEVGLMGDLPLFAPSGAGVRGDGVRLERSDDAALRFLVRLLRAAAGRLGVAPVEMNGKRVRAVAIPGGPALLATRLGDSARWRVLLAMGGAVAEGVAARTGDAVRGDVGRAA